MSVTCVTHYIDKTECKTVELEDICICFIPKSEAMQPYEIYMNLNTHVTLIMLHYTPKRDFLQSP